MYFVTVLLIWIKFWSRGLWSKGLTRKLGVRTVMKQKTRIDFLSYPNLGMHVYEGTWKQKKMNEVCKYWRFEWPRGVKTRGKNAFCTFPHTSFLVLYCAGHLVRSQSESKLALEPCSTCTLTVRVVRNLSISLSKRWLYSRVYCCVVHRVELRPRFALWRIFLLRDVKA